GGQRPDIKLIPDAVFWQPSSGDGYDDGDEDLNHNGQGDSGETDPNDANRYPEDFPWELFLPAIMN
ncbi:MAG: hypothetical protein V3T59_05020, partial [Desulfobacterales bacterium]